MVLFIMCKYHLETTHAFGCGRTVGRWIQHKELRNTLHSSDGGKKLAIGPVFDVAIFGGRKLFEFLECGLDIELLCKVLDLCRQVLSLDDFLRCIPCSAKVGWGRLYGIGMSALFRGGGHR